MSIDKSIHEVYEKLNNGYIRWHDFQEVGVDEHYYQWYYAENRLYVIQDVMTGEWWFVMARSPVNALAMYKERLSEVARAGAWEGEQP